MSDEKNGLWERLIATKRGNQEAQEPQNTESRLKSYLENEKTRSKSGELVIQPEQVEEPADKRRPVPILTGRLADYLSKQAARTQIASVNVTDKQTEPWTINDPQTRAAIAMSLILTSQLSSYAGTGIGGQWLNDARDNALRGFSGRDAVKIEVEAYELLNWFAAAIDPAWQQKAVERGEIVEKSASEDALNRILERAIRENIDLNMRYYTGSRGEFSERVISPLSIHAEKYLIAFCHKRNEERVFRLSRILQLTPVEANEQTKDMFFPVYRDESDGRSPASGVESVDRLIETISSRASANRNRTETEMPKAETGNSPKKTSKKETGDSPKKTSKKENTKQKDTDRTKKNSKNTGVQKSLPGLFED